ncbi:MAG: tetratricopeptide repeat protein [Chitinophaga sp.]|uniref:tetratricopeptide repeat protein n=1 Tax=Chitinophaga sp. TaxID=1869181 RepID=UPI001B22CC88|nr:tetratricopeptide repeat protein [Chitinophaga sp.]MBO9731039.1 tetratricopeptide repeat protein [Chitinophaga sp.]
MVLSMSDQMNEVLLDARNFSIDKKIYYIDSILLLQVLLRRNDFLLPIPEEDKQVLQQRLSAYSWPEINTTPNLENIPLTIQLEGMIKGALKIKQRFYHTQGGLTAEHLMLVMLSVKGNCRNQLERVGLIFEDYVHALQQKIKQEPGKEIVYTLKVCRDSAARDSQRDAFLEGVTRFFSGKSARKKIAYRNLLAADYYYRYNQFKLCRNYCTYALKASPDACEALILYAEAWMKEHAYDKAYPHLKEALLLDPENIRIRVTMVSCLYLMGAVQEAETLCRQLPHDMDDCYLLSNLGFFYADTGKYEQAISMLDRAIRLGDEEYNIFAYNNKGYALMQLEQLDTAREFILKSLTLHKGNAHAYRNLGLLYLKENNPVAAKEALLQAKRFSFAVDCGPDVDKLLATLE